MIKPTSTIKDLYGHMIKRRINLATLSLILLGGVNFAQSKIDPKFEDLLAYQKNEKVNEKDLTKYEEENSLYTSIVINPNGLTEKLYQTIVYTNNPKKFDNQGYLIQSYSKNFFTALLNLNQIEQLGRNEEVIGIESPKFAYVDNVDNVTTSGASLLHQGVLNNRNYLGNNVLVGILDTGIDYKHPDFSRTGASDQSRILRIWDQTLTPNANENSPTGFNYGVEYTNAHINDEIDGTPANYIRQRDIHGHGTHVAGTVAGNGSSLGNGLYKGGAPEAELIIVKGGDTGATNVNIINGLDYFHKIATDLGKPIVVNMSLGSHSNPHLGRTAEALKINEFTTLAPGRILVASAGNEGGFGRYQSLSLAPNQSQLISVQVPQLTANEQNTLLFQLITYNRADNDFSNVRLTITSPNGDVFVKEPDTPTSSFVSALPNNAGNITFSSQNYRDNISGKRATNTIVRRSSASLQPQGTYTFLFENISENNIIIDGWVLNAGSTIGSYNPNGSTLNTIGSLGSATNAITVSNYVGNNTFIVNRNNGGARFITLATQQINPGSSNGPRLDGYPKPEISADGTLVVSALSSSTDTSNNNTNLINTYYRTMTGTSMASPGVAGAIALLLEANPNLTVNEVKERITTNAKKDQYTTQSYTPQYGYGKINIYNAVLDELNRANNNQNCPAGNFTIFGYDNYSTSYTAQNINPALKNIQQFSGFNQRVAVKYTPNMTGKLKGVYAMLGTNSTSTPKPFQIEIRKANENGLPGDIIGVKQFENINDTYFWGWNNIDVSDLDIDVQVNQDIFVVVVSDQHSLQFFADNTNVDGKTYLSNDQGQSFIQENSYDAKIRIIVHENSAAVHQLATLDSSTNQNFGDGINQVVNNCEVVTRIEASGSIPVTGNTTTKIWLGTHSNEFVNRRVEVANNTTNATGKITLFFNQDEFNTFNTNNAVKLPTSNTDEANKANLKVFFFGGASSDNTGNHTSYTNAPQVVTITPEQVKWNATYNYWEVTLDYLGAGGYFLATSSTLNNIDLALNKIEIFPNPVVDFVTISIPQGVNNAAYKLTDITGKLINEQKLNSNSNKINLSQLAQGVYILEINTDKGTINKKLIKK